MKDVDTTKEEVGNELIQSRQRIAGSDNSEAEQKQAEEALGKMEERYTLAIEAGRVGTWDWNLRTNEIYLDPNLKAMLGYANHEIRNHLDHWGKFVHPEDVEEVMTKANAHLEGRTPNYEVTHRMLHKNGSIRWFLARGKAIRDTRGKPYRVLGTDTDVTEHKLAEEELTKYREQLEELVKERTAELRRTNEQLGQEIAVRRQVEEALRHSEEKYRLVVENANQVIVVAQDWKIKFINRQATQILGYSIEDVISKPFLEFAHPEDRVLLAERHEKRLRGEDVPLVYCFRVIAKDGDARWLEISSVPISWESRPATLNFLSDITERKHLEEQLLWSQKMETVGRLAGGVAHEFNNLLAVVLMNTELAMMSLPSNSQTRKYLEAIRRNSDLGAKIAGQLLAFSRRQIIKPQVINLSSVLLEMDKMLRSLIGENIELQIQPSEHLGRIRVDRSQIEQVLVNLVVNARDAMPHGGKLTIIATNITIDEDHAREYACVAPGEYVMLTVSDTGVGMTEEIRAHLFEPFYTTKEVGKGTGLGLATCYGIVSQNGRNIRADSKPDKGTTFRIYLPRVYEEVEVPFDGAESESLPQGTETVLLVEDEPSVRNVVALALRELGYTVLEAGNGEEGLEVAEKYGGGKIHLLLTDVVMPKMWGKELSERLRTAHPNIRTIFFSGYPGDVVVDYGVLDPDIDFVPKPFSGTVLARRVREVLDNEAPKA